MQKAELINYESSRKGPWDLANIGFGKNKENFGKILLMTFTYHSTCYFLNKGRRKDGWVSGGRGDSLGEC
jgi:hypothetical protein